MDGCGGFCDLAVAGAQACNLDLISELMRQLMLCSLVEHEEFCRIREFYNSYAVHVSVEMHFAYHIVFIVLRDE